MTLQISAGAVDLDPVLRLGFETATPSATITHVMLDGSVSLTRRPGNTLRAGTLSLFYSTASAAEAARASLLTEAGPWVLADDVTEVEMTFHVVGDVTIEQQTARLRWVLKTGFQEVDA